MFFEICSNIMKIGTNEVGFGFHELSFSGKESARLPQGLERGFGQEFKEIEGESKVFPPLLLSPSCVFPYKRPGAINVPCFGVFHFLQFGAGPFVLLPDIITFGSPGGGKDIEIQGGSLKERKRKRQIGDFLSSAGDFQRS